MAETPTPLSLSRSSLLSRLTLNSLGSFSLSKPKLHSSTANHHDQRWWSKAPSFWSVCLEIWVWVWISKVGFLLGMAKSQRCLCFDLGFVSSVYFQGLGFEDISKWVYWAVWPCVYVLCSYTNVNLSMCKQNVFKHRHVYMSKTDKKVRAFMFRNACLCE